jgi:hypothetical protein
VDGNKIMELNLIHDYVYTRSLNLKLDTVKSSCLTFEKFVKDNIVDDGTGFDGKENKGKVPAAAKLFSQYNLLMYPLPGFHELYKEIRDTFWAAKQHAGDNNSTEYYAQCWLNCYQAGEYIDWHYHWLPENHAWHGFFCVDVEPNSYTSYQIPGVDNVDIASKNNLLILSKSNGDLHKSSEWLDTTRPRITIAFDILPAYKLCEQGYQGMLNHWVPI